MRFNLVVLAALAAGSTLSAAVSDGRRYLPTDDVDLVAILPPPPVDGSPADRADRTIFRNSRALAGSARWRQAIQDVDESVPALLVDFSRAAGRPLSADKLPVLVHLLTSMRRDVSAPVDVAKEHFHRARPFLRDGGVVCQPRSAMRGSFDYPSGHTSWGTAVSIVLAELMPDHATQILARGRDYGDSRMICGAHNASAVAAGRLAAAAIVARLHGDAGFRADLDRARRELAMS